MQPLICDEWLLLRTCHSYVPSHSGEQASLYSRPIVFPDFRFGYELRAEVYESGRVEFYTGIPMVIKGKDLFHRRAHVLECDIGALEMVAPTVSSLAQKAKDLCKD